MRRRAATPIVFDVRLPKYGIARRSLCRHRIRARKPHLPRDGRELVASCRYNRDFVRRWWNWEEYLRDECPEREATFENLERAFLEMYASFTFEFAAHESGIDEHCLREIADIVATAGARLPSHTWRSATAGNLGGWQV